MNRPKINDYALKDGAYSLKYVTDLEKYCNVLEERCNVLEKALDRACKQASCQYIKIEDEYCEHDFERDYEHDCERCLKNHFMKEAQDD